MRFRRSTKDGLMFGLLILLVASLMLNVFTLSDYLGNSQTARLEDVIKESTPAVVSIFSPDKSGSGIIVTKDGYILTNDHVISGQENVTVLLEDNRIYQANIVGSDDKTDVAVLKINENNLPVLKLGDSDKIEVGEQVITIGQPFGLAHTVTTGIVSGKHRNRGPTLYRDFIQTDASINPGNSGGPLLNMDGEVIGLNTFIVSDVRAGEQGFAIPINLVNKVYGQILEDGKVVRGYFGVGVVDVVDVNNQTGEGRILKGSKIVNIEDKSAADNAGLEVGDIIVKIENITIENSNHLRNEIAWITPGENITVSILRDDKLMNLGITVDERPDE